MSTPFHRLSRHRRGMLLLVVAALAALLAAMSLTFLITARNAGQQAVVIEQHAQARLMLMAACSYILESGRIGYHNAAGANAEAYGWIDVRDGAIGPRLRGTADPSIGVVPQGVNLTPVAEGARPALARWPAIGSAMRAPMNALVRPPFAIRAIAATNPVGNDAGDSTTFGMPYLRNLPVQPVATTWNEFNDGDRRPLAATANRAWFRTYRDGPATFVITVGAGGTQGFRNWAEVLAQGADDRFASDPDVFATLRAAEVRQWFRVEWSASVANPEVHHNHPFAQNNDPAIAFGINVTEAQSLKRTTGYGAPNRSLPHARNSAGTIRWVSRLRTEPTFW